MLPQDLAHVVDSRYADVAPAKEALECELHRLLRFPHHVRPPAVLVENVEVPKAPPCAVEVVVREIVPAQRRRGSRTQ